ncbi:TetR/AcrR family transcriptional regulator [Allorhizobium taibaishanense]|uniref:AcrR family transcriptional regulator n=1 Tax=Allorhizobium taibaishanense TaxID=887144 RepID=A0A1Q9A021_9HYPH|nr:TetR/AcrR family transcriptional regulator [Allorhizobium taibaishanense]MBB4010534.1 AcrR family transcriptional regulator [Allorhizobium taibaishanense]OLP47928.1 TetR family transcriptional regulator [Allorhizobium taibaishanense]
MRADAKENYHHLLVAARDVITQQGAGASLRDIARRAEVSHVTLLRHFPTREALLDALLRKSLEELTAKAGSLELSSSPGEALLIWLRDAVGFVQVYSGVVTIMAAALADPQSALHTSCDELRKAGERLLKRAQAQGVARSDMEGSDLFALIGALGWMNDQAPFKPRAEYLFEVVSNAIMVRQ